MKTMRLYIGDRLIKTTSVETSVPIPENEQDKITYVFYGVGVVDSVKKRNGYAKVNLVDGGFVKMIQSELPEWIKPGCRIGFKVADKISIIQIP